MWQEGWHFGTAVYVTVALTAESMSVLSIVHLGLKWLFFLVCVWNKLQPHTLLLQVGINGSAQVENK